MKHIDIIDALTNKELIGTEITVCGWVRTSRDSKNMAFIELNDGTSFKHLQIVIDKAVLSEISEFMKLGTSLKVEGTVVESAVAVDSVEINAEKIDIITENIVKQVIIPNFIPMNFSVLTGVENIYPFHFVLKSAETASRIP